MASWDTPAVSSPTTRDYAAPLVDFSSLGNLKQDYYKNREMERGEAKATMFRNGIPKDAAGNFDIPAITEQAGKIGGLDYAQPLLNMQLQSQVGNAAADTIRNPGGSPASPVTASAPPANVQQTGQPAARPAASPAPMRTAGTPQGDQPGSIISTLSEAGIPNSDIGAMAGRFASVLKIDPNAALTPEQRAMVLKRIEPFRGKLGVVQASSEGIPAPAAAQASTPPAAAQPQPQQPSQGVPSALEGVPAADRLDAESQMIRAKAAQISAFNKPGAEVLNKEADARADRAKQLREQSALAPAIKEWRQSGTNLSYPEWVAQTEGDKETAKQDAKAYGEKYGQLVESGIKAQQEIPQLELLQKQMDDPNFFSGAGEKYNLLYKRLKAAVGMDPDAAVPQELLRKVTASNVLGSLSQLKGLGPIRVAEMNMAREAAAAPDNSVPANKLLVEISKRTHQRAAEIADMAQTYKQQNGALDAGFDKKVTGYYKAHPLFSDKEIENWHQIAGQQQQASAQPQPGQPVHISSKAEYDKLAPGTPFTGPDGKPWRKP